MSAPISEDVLARAVDFTRKTDTRFGQLIVNAIYLSAKEEQPIHPGSPHGLAADKVFNRIFFIENNQLEKALLMYMDQVAADTPDVAGAAG